MEIYSNKTVNISEYTDSVFVPHNCDKYVLGVYTLDGNYIEHTGKRIYGSNEYTYGFANGIENDVEDYLSDTVIWLGYLRGHYGHCIIDEMSRLWWVVNEDGLKNKKIVCDSTTGSAKSFYLDIFKLLGIDLERIMFVNKITKIARIVVPDFSYLPGQYITPSYFDTFQYALRKIKPQKYERLYLSRRHFAKKNRIIEIGEKKVENIFEQNGFKIIFPEEMPLIEQLEYYKGCRILVSTNGSLAHNILWCRQGTSQVIINRFRNAENPHQDMINELLGNKIIKIDAYTKRSCHQHCCLYIGKELKEFCKDNGMSCTVHLLQQMIDMITFHLLVSLKELYHKLRNFTYKITQM